MRKTAAAIAIILTLSILVPLVIPPAALATEEMAPVAPVIRDATPGSSCRAVYGVCVMPCVTVVEK